jgi:Pyruvate/2-oxoacid:ferredoxin oxidoreductase delta subunit
MEGEGPSGGRPRPVGRILASPNAVALDAVMAAMMGLDPARVPTLRIAGDRGLGPTDLAAIRIDGPMGVVPNFRVPRIGMGVGSLFARLGARLIVTRPEVRYSRCVRCGLCAKACPVDAIEMTPRGPVINRATCIHCFCCHEMCRYEAMTFSRRMRLLRRLGR